MVFNTMLTIGFFPVANPNNVCKGFSLLLLCTQLNIWFIVHGSNNNENTRKLQPIVHINSISIAQYTCEIHISILYFNLNLQLDQMISIPFGLDKVVADKFLLPPQQRPQVSMTWVKSHLQQFVVRLFQNMRSRNHLFPSPVSNMPRLVGSSMVQMALKKCGENA